MGIRPKFVAFIPARGGSKSIPMKNIRPMAGRPLIHWALAAALGCDGIERVVVATDHDGIAETAQALENLEASYVVQRASFTELYDASRRLLKHQLDLARSERDERRARAALVTALGRKETP